MDSRRRGAQKRPAQSEGHELWSKLTTSFSRINEALTSQDLADRIMRANRLSNEIEVALAAEDHAAFDKLFSKLYPLLEHIKRMTQEDQTLMAETVETLSVLKGIRVYDEAARVQAANEKRNNKRQKMSPSAPPGPTRPGLPGSLAAAGQTPSGSRSGSVGRPKKNLVAQTPAERLRLGREVAFHRPQLGQDAQWILAKVVEVVGANKYIIQDVDVPADGDADKYEASSKEIIPLPDSTTPNPYQGIPNYPKGTRVLAQYPETTSFYPGQILSGRHPSAGAKGGETYALEFDDDEGMERRVPAHRVALMPVD